MASVEKLWRIFKHGSIMIDVHGDICLRNDIGNEKSDFCPTRDHILPKSRNGGSGVDNLSICSKKTNRIKGDKTRWWYNGICFSVQKTKNTHRIFKRDSEKKEWILA